MKRLTAIILIALALPVSVSAQSVEKKEIHWDVRGGMSMLSSLSSNTMMRPYTAWTYYGGGRRSLAAIYGDYNGSVTATNNIGAEALIHFGKRSSVGFGIYANHIWCDRYNGVSNQKTGTNKAAALMLLPTYRVYYMSRDMVRLYGTVSIGLMAYFNNDSRSIPADPAISLSPIGVEVGRTWYGFLEAGVGSVYMGFSFGAGYRF